MPHTKYVVKFDANTNAYLTSYTGPLEYANCDWGSLASAMEFDTLGEVEEIADKINSGTVGLPKPS